MLPKVRCPKPISLCDKPDSNSVIVGKRWETTQLKMSDNAETTPSQPPAPAGETYSKEFVDDLKAQLARQSEVAAKMQARQEAEDNRRRETLKELQPTVTAFVKDAMDDESMAPYKHEMGPMTAFAAELHEAQSIDTALPLARMISCHSAKFKRKVEEFAQTSDAADQLAKANKELDEVKADRDAKSARVDELTTLCDERLKAAEALQAELAKVGGIKEKYDFSKLGSREVANASAGSAGSEKKEKAPQMDPLLAHVLSAGGQGGLRMKSSGTAHHLLGTPQSTDNAHDIAAAIRMA